MKTRMVVCLLLLPCILIPCRPATGQVSPAVIDPEVAYATYYGGTGDDTPFGIVFNPAGEVWLAGDGYSTNLPFVKGYQDKPLGSREGFLVRLNAKGDELLYSSYISGSALDIIDGLFIDSQENLYIAGTTYSTNFPLGPGGYETSRQGGRCAYIIKMNKDADTILAGTFYGGTGFEWVRGAAMDAQTNIYIVGDTTSTNIPTTPNAFQTNDLPDTDGYLAVFDSSLTNLLLGTYLGGNDSDVPYSVAVHPVTRDILVGGFTKSTNYPLTNNFLDITISNRTGFVTLIASNGQDLLFSTYLGGRSGSCVSVVGFYTNESILACGYTHSPDFPVTNAFQDTFAGQGAGGIDYDAFLTMFTTDRTGLAYSTYLGGTYDETVVAMRYDDRGRIYLAGATTSTNFPVTGNAYQPQHSQPADTYRDAFLAVFTPEPTGLVYATYFGGTDDDYSSCIAVDQYGAMYLVLYSDNGTDWATTNALYPTPLGGQDAGVVKFVEPYIRFDAMAPGTGGAEISWYTDGRKSAVVEYADDPGSDWNQLGTYSNLELTGSSMTITDTAPTAATRCYRLRPQR